MEAWAEAGANVLEIGHGLFSIIRCICNIRSATSRQYPCSKRFAQQASGQELRLDYPKIKPVQWVSALTESAELVFPVERATSKRASVSPEWPLVKA